MTAPLYQLSCRLISGEMQPLARYRGDVLLVVNTASYCGFTPQYEGLETLYRDYHGRGFHVLAFPSNDFLQDPGDNERIHDFCLRSYGLSYPLFAKVHVNGPHQHPLFQLLKEQAPGLWLSRAIKWNFSKFLVDRAGCVVGRFGPLTVPTRLREQIETLLDAPRPASSAAGSR